MTKSDYRSSEVTQLTTLTLFDSPSLQMPISHMSKVKTIMDLKEIAYGEIKCQTVLLQTRENAV